MRKNFILWRRRIFGSLAEILFPCIMFLILLAIRGAISADDNDQESFLNKMQVVKPSAGSNITIDDYYSDHFYFSSRPVIDNCLDMNFLKCAEYFDDDKYIRRNALSPDHSFTRALGAKIDQNCNLKDTYTTEFYDSNSDIMDDIETWDYEDEDSDSGKFCFSVSFNDPPEDLNYDYRIRFNRSVTAPPNGKQFGDFIDGFNLDDFKAMDDLITNPIPDFQYNFIETGFLQIMNWVDNLILKEVLTDSGQNDKKNNAYIAASFVPMYFDDYVEDGFASVIAMTVPLFVTISYMIPVCRMISQIINEKETKIKEAMLMMGLTRSAYWLSWITYYGIVYLIITIINTIISAGIFKYSNPGIIFITLLLYAYACMCFSLLISVIFSKSRSGVLVGLMLFFISYFISFAVDDQDRPYGSKSAASLMLNTALGLTMGVLSKLESGQQGVQNYNVNQMYNNYTYGTGIAFFVIDGTIYFLLALYLEQVWPQEWGVSEPWYFLFTRKFWCRSKEIPRELKEDVKWGPSVEPVDPSLEEQKKNGKAMIVRNFRKVFGDKVAVEDLSLDIYEGQIFALLGHNGAGKTTTFSMMTGLIPPTAGNMTVQGKVLSQDLTELRKLLGVCPQHNVLFSDLNVEEHLRLFCVFKGKTNTELVKQEVDTKIKEVNLENKRTTLAKNLSGGQKRRLSLAIALIADSPIVLLDEPTSGMDLTARRQMWDMLKDNKAGRIIILTTHYMEEADILADRIAIMSEGTLRCMGSSLFLKNRYGVGYTLTIVKENGVASHEHSAMLTDFVKKYIPEAHLNNDIHAEISFKLPLSSSMVFVEFFAELDSSMKAFQLKSYAISVTTLEEVFIRVAHGDDNSLINKMEVEMSNIENEDETEKALLNNPDFMLERDRLKTSRTLAHFGALVRKRVLITWRDIKGILFEIMIPIFMVLMGLGLMTISNFYTSYSPWDLKIDQYDTPQNFLYGGTTSSSVIRGLLLNSDIEVTDSNIGLNVLSNGTEINIAQFDEMIYSTRKMPDNDRAGAVWFVKSDTINHQYEAVIFHNQTAFQAAPTIYAAYSKAILQSIKEDVNVEVSNQPFPPTEKVLKAANVGDGFLASIVFSLGFAFIPAGIISFVVQERETAVKHQHLVSGVSLSAYWISIFVWDIAKHIIPSVVCCALIAAFDIDSLNNPDDAYGVCWVIILMYGMAVAPFSYVTSFFFTSAANAMVLTVLINFTLGSLIPPALFIMYFFDSTRKVAKGLRWFFRIFPTFCFGMSFLDLTSRETFAALDGNSNYEPFDIEAAGGDILMMGIDILLYSLILIICEFVESSPSVRQWFRRAPTIAPTNYTPDDDVEQEKEDALQAEPSSVTVNLKGARQVYSTLEGCSYKNLVAVEDVSFNVHKQECFALLGVNGAGKTSTFRILTGEYSPTSGEAYIGGLSVSKNLRNARKLIGYCPQFDSLNAQLTGLEHLELYCVLKDIPVERRTELIEFTLKELDLEKYRNIRAGTYSGGNKRKLSVAIALLGSPSVLFMDEPSAGMDPEARKKMWRVIGNLKRRNGSVILTTHSMEEVEALCDRLTIMVSGRLRCIGTPTQIKNKFGSGYEVEVKIQIPTNEEVQTRLEMLKNRNLYQDKVTKANLEAFLAEINAYPELLSQIYGMDPSAAPIISQLETENCITETALAAWVITEECGWDTLRMLQSNFGRVEPLEHYLSFFKFKVEKQEDKSLGFLFSVLESNKEVLRVSEYSVSQTSLEQIFNSFAKLSENSVMRAYMTAQ